MMSSKTQMVTEEESNYSDLDKMSVKEILSNINREDKTVAFSVERCIPQLEKLVTATVEKMQKGGRLFYLGAGTSGRLGIIDASECPPTFGVSFSKVIGIIAGGDAAIRKAVEFAEDNIEQGWEDLQPYELRCNDIIVGITASGYAPYVLGTLKKANEQGITTACIVCNLGTPVASEVKYPVEVVVGPEFISGSTRMKAGTAQKMVLNMLSSSVMIQLGRVRGNKMVDMQLTNSKLYKRGIHIIMKETGADEQTASELLMEYGSVRLSIENYKNKKQCPQ